MSNKIFLDIKLLESQDVISLLGPSGTGKSFCANFLQHFGYYIVPQLTTRAPREDDKHYIYISHQQFVYGLNNGEILGYYSGNINTLQGGNGYGYYIKDLKNLLLNPNAKLILFPSAYELKSNTFIVNYGNTTKIALTFSNPNTVVTRAKYAGKKFDSQELLNRINLVLELSKLMKEYQNKSGDKNYHLIVSDSFGDNKQLSEKSQLLKVCEILNISKEDFDKAFNIEKEICK